MASKIATSSVRPAARRRATVPAPSSGEWSKRDLIRGRHQRRIQRGRRADGQRAHGRRIAQALGDRVGNEGPLAPVERSIAVQGMLPPGRQRFVGTRAHGRIQGARAVGSRPVGDGRAQVWRRCWLGGQRCNLHGVVELNAHCIGHTIEVAKVGRQEHHLKDGLIGQPGGARLRQAAGVQLPGGLGDHAREVRQRADQRIGGALGNCARIRDHRPRQRSVRKRNTQKLCVSAGSIEALVQA